MCTRVYVDGHRVKSNDGDFYVYDYWRTVYILQPTNIDGPSMCYKHTRV